MAKCIRLALLVLSLMLLGACGPDTIFLRPALDTPDQHVKNGHNLLARGKIDAASAEFERAKILDDAYAPAYIGIALVKGHRGDIDGGLKILNLARELADTPEETGAVDQGFNLLEEMRATAQD
ncbi:hypothetical protein DSCA_45350 [Desulfosarcina alkanivorans]|uniref:Lipoprotein n=1 Tax=Desulfosarcina alkanivorans TaxID=571177 RepID=A0A5K7YQK2_9BACT|nr:hypothetical protein [Desulfosarcina alkanivorans]BBO70605.1 hypothetical protein DSCA_45350 [Desulfosarcina alkanivorans]